MTGEAGHLDLLRTLEADRWLAHQHLFRHRHPEESSPAHRDMVRAIHSPDPRINIEGFRGIGKTTYTEEAALLMCAFSAVSAVVGPDLFGPEFRPVHNFIVIGPSFPRACDRVDAIANEIAVNPWFDDKEGLFGRLRGNKWEAGRIVIAGDICLQALGRDQAITGLKFLQWRPDAFIIDDIEDPEEKRNDAEREATWRWLKQTFQPCLDDALLTWGRFLGTRRGSNSLPERLEKDGVPTVKFPIESLDDGGNRVATWPGKFPLSKIDRMLYDYRGDMDLYNQEFMCRSTSAAARVFRREMFRVEPRVRTWEAVYAFVDPARTSHGKAASTGWAVWSWVQNRLVVWASGAEFIAPDEIVALIFDIAERYDPIWVMTEIDGLVQWLLQPIRQEQLRRGVTIPVKGVRAITGTRGAGQVRFVEGLQPYFAAREVVFAQDQPDLEKQLLSFPHGIRDTANALAYAPTTKPAAPIYDGFDPESHIAHGVEIAAGQRLMLAANATGAMTSAVLLQSFERRLRILADWVFEGAPAERAVDIAEAAAQVIDTSRIVAVRVERAWDDMLKLPLPDRMLSRPNRPAWVVPQIHSDQYMNVGLMQAVRAVPSEARAGGIEVKGRLYLADALQRTVRGIPCVQVSPAARWTLRALAGGYTRTLQRGQLSEEAEEGPYRVLMEGVESFCALIGAAEVDNAEDEAQNYRVDERTGRRYASAMPARIR